MFASRRQLITGAAATTAFAGLSRFAAAANSPSDLQANAYASEVAGYGPLRTDPFGVFDLPEGFSYTVVARAGERMSDGLVTPFDKLAEADEELTGESTAGGRDSA